MAESSRVRPSSPLPPVEQQSKWRVREKKGLEEGIIVVKGKASPYILREQGYIRHYSLPWMDDTSHDILMMFMHQVPVHSGKHIHQGGFGLFVLDGKGYTVVDGVRHDWEEGDLILLPIKAGGVEHQHFNLDPNKPSRWLAMTSRIFREVLSRRTKQRSLAPDWQELKGNKVEAFEDELSGGEP